MEITGNLGSDTDNPRVDWACSQRNEPWISLYGLSSEQKRSIEIIVNTIVNNMRSRNLPRSEHDELGQALQVTSSLDGAEIYVGFSDKAYILVAQRIAREINATGIGHATASRDHYDSGVDDDDLL